MPDDNKTSPALPLSEDEAAILKEAKILIEAFGSTASVDAWEASSAYAEGGDNEMAKFWLRVEAKIMELQGAR